MKFNLDCSDIGVVYCDSGPWRCYGVASTGNSVEAFIQNAVIYETDQDGGELDCYEIDDAPNDKIYIAAMQIISQYLKKQKTLEKK